MSLAKIFPFPHPVEIDGKTYYVKECQIRHLAFLQNFVENQVSHPYYSVREGPREGESQVDWNERVHDAFKRSESWKPKYGDPETMESIDHKKLLGIILSMALRDNDPPLTRAKCNEMIPSISITQWDEISSIFFAKNIQRSLIHLVDPEFGTSEVNATDEDGLEWTEAIEVFLKVRTGLTYEDVGDMYFSQWNNFWSQGKEEEYETSMEVDLSMFENPEMAAMHMIELSRKQRMKVYGTDKLDERKDPRDKVAENAIRMVIEKEHGENNQEDRYKKDGWVYPENSKDGVK